jgi:transketolase
MRNAFADEVAKLANEDERVVLLSGDIGNRLFDRLKERAPNRFYNCGIAEANMISVAAGMAICGLRPVAYTITPFITARCLEQIRVDVCYQRMPVIIVGTGSGLSYASLNATHHSCEDIASLRVLPNMTVLCPGDPSEVRSALRAALKHDGPVYIRIGKKGEPVVHNEPPRFEIGNWIRLRDSGDVSLLSTGNVLPLAVEVADSLDRRGISCGLFSCHTVKPLDHETLSKAFDRSQLVVVLEEHSMLGGFGGAVAEWLSDYARRCARLLRVGTSDAFLYEAAEQAHARERYGLTVASIVERITTHLAIGCRS